MSRVFVIPDIHLKPEILDKAEEELTKQKYDAIVCLGDLVDDWGQQENLKLYRETFEKIVSFIQRHPGFYLCLGNHDVSYLWETLETGYSQPASDTVLEGLEQIRRVLPAERIAYVHRIDNVLFSHAGLTETFVSTFFPGFNGGMEELLKKMNSFGKEEMWKDVSPIWARPQDGYAMPYAPELLQVVGHTPVRKTDYCNGFLTVDNFSTYSNGIPVGDQRFVWVDTETKQWGFCSFFHCSRGSDIS